jgi:hypothetical protein
LVHDARIWVTEARAPPRFPIAFGVAFSESFAGISVLLLALMAGMSFMIANLNSALIWAYALLAFPALVMGNFILSI